MYVFNFLSFILFVCIGGGSCPFMSFFFVQAIVVL